MGAYLSEPITKKISSDESGTSVACGASSMQGWRVSQEDAHNCCIDFDENTSLFAVYDGHGGHEVATYCAKELPRFIKNTETYKAGNIRQALIDAFLGFDATLTKPNIIALLKEIAGSNENDKAKAGYCDSDLSSEESVSDLRKEAAMPLEQVIARYQRPELEFESKEIKEDINDGGIGQSSPYLRCRRTRDKSGGSTSGHCSTDPGCSSSSSSWKASQQDTDDKASADARPASPNRDKNIDTGTSNGSVDRAAEPPAEAAQTTKSTADIPDSSEDVKEQQTQSTDSIAASAGNADSSKTSRDDVSSSSSAGPVENGQGETVSRRKMLNLYYQSLSRKRSCNSRRKHYLCNPQSSKPGDNDDEDDDDDDDQDDDDDDEENDETFDGQHASSDDDLHKMDGNEDTNSSSSSSTNGDNANLKDEDDEDDDDDDEDDDDDDENDENDDDSLGLDFTMNMPEEPGSDSGCTAVVAILHARDLYVANAGDSRCVLCRDGQALELSLDHKPEDEPEMERIIKAGGKVTGDGRVNGGLNLSRALGDHAYKQNTALPADEQMISALPDVRHIAIEPGRDEFMILACDGIWNFMSSQEVVSFIRPRLANLKESNISSICEELFDHCLAPDTHGDGTGCDNMTAVIVKFIWKDDAANNGSNPVCKVISGQANQTKKRPISPDNTSEVASAADAAPNNDRESSASDNNAEKHNPADCTTSTSSNDSAVKDSCKRLKSEIV